MPDQGIPTPPGYNADDVVDAPQAQNQSVPLPPGYKAEDIVDTQADQAKAAAKAQNDQHVENFVNPQRGSDAWYQQKLGQAIPESATPALAAAKKYLVDPFEQLAQWGHEYGSKHMEASIAEAGYHPIRHGAAQAVLGPLAPFESMIMSDPGDIDKLEKEHAIVAGVSKGLGGTAGSIIADPRNWPLMGASEAMPVLESMMKGPFAVQMTYGAHEALKNIYDNWDKMSPGERSQQMTEAGMQTVFAEEALRHAHVRKAIAKNIVDHVDSRVQAAVGPTTEQTPMGAQIPVRSDTKLAQFANKAVPEAAEKFAQTQTAPAVSKALGGTIGEAIGSEAATTSTPEDRMGVKGHAKDLIENQARPVYKRLDELSDNKFTEAQNKIDSGWGQRDKEKIAEGEKEKKAIIDNFRVDLADEGLDVDAADRAYGRGKAAERMATRLDTATGVSDVEGAPHKLDGNRLAKVVDDGIKNGSWKRMGLTDEHIAELQKLSSIASRETTVPKFNKYVSALGKAAVYAAGLHGGALTALEAAGGVSATDYIVGKIAKHTFEDALTNPEMTKAMTRGLRTGDPAPVISAATRVNGWIEKTKGLIKDLSEKAKSQRGSLSWGGGIDTSDTPRTPGIRRGRISQEGLGAGLDQRGEERGPDSDQAYLKTLEDKISAGGPGREKAIEDRTKLLMRMQGVTFDESGAEARAQAGKTRKMSEERKPANPDAPRGPKAPQTFEENLAARKAQRLASQRGAAGAGIDNSNTIQKPGIRRGKTAAQSADSFQEKAGNDAIQPVTPEVHPQAKEIADEYSKMRHDPSDPEVQKSYSSLKNDIDAQWEHATADGFKFEPWEKEGQPYANSKEMKKDVDENKHLYFFTGGDLPTDHPMAQTDPKTGLSYNDKFRAVHDLYGHAAGGYEFGPKGEEAAYKTHAQMLSPESIPALTTETRGQNNWVNFGEHLRDEAGNVPKKGEAGYVSPVDRPYADNKAGLLPKKYHGAPAAATGGKLQLNHWSNKDNLTETDPEHMGTGKPGREMARSSEPGFLKRTNFGTEGYKERAIQGQQHQYTASVDADKYYDAEKDPEGIWKKGFEKGGATGAERAVKDAGYHGYQVPSRNEVASFEKVPVTKVPQTLGSDAAAQSDTANWNQAKQELGSAASFSDIAKRAQEIKAESNPPVPRETTTVPGYRAEVGTTRVGKDGKVDILREVPISKLRMPEGNRLRPLDVSKYKEDIASGKGVDYPVVEDGLVDNGNHRIEALKQSGETTAKVWERQGLSKPDMSGSELATRYPTSVKADTTNNPANTTGMEAIDQADKISPARMTQGGKPVLGIKQKLVAALHDYRDNGLRFTAEDLANPEKALRKAIDHVAGNLEWLHNNMPESIRTQAKKWYESAHDLTKKWSDQYGVSHEQAAAVVAALSPKNAWDNNVGQAERLMQHFAEDQNHAWTPEMDNTALRIRSSDAVNAAFGRMINDIRGKTLDQLKAKTPEALLAKKAIWYRILDEAHGSKSTPNYSPDGTVRGSSTMTWGQWEPVAKALSILENGNLQHIHEAMGQGHKIRNFYNNIINPWSERGHTTIDTHAVGAGYLKPMSQDDVEVAHNFGSGNKKGTPSPPKHAETGLKGTYPIYEEAYKQAAAKLELQPRELQSITWEGIRSLMGDDKKTPELRRAVTDIWRAHEMGHLSLDEARNEIVKASGGFAQPSWMKDSDWEGKPTEDQGDTNFDFGD